MGGREDQSIQKTEKSVIFVGGTAYSGSTLLCLSLANDESGFATGEVQHAFFPWMRGHKNYLEKCTCGEKPCSLWQGVIESGPNEVYCALFDSMPDVNFLVDSSKNIYWIKDHLTHLHAQGINAHHVLVWKSPAELKASYEKRNLSRDWLNDWILYHRLYFTLMPKHLTISYGEYTAKPTETLRKVCDYVGTDYFSGKEDYWNKKFHTLGGNPSARVHLYSDKSSEFESASKSITSSQGGLRKADHQKIYKTNIRGDAELLKDSPMGLALLEYLQKGAPEASASREVFRLSRSQLLRGRVRLWAKRRYGRFKFNF